MFTVAQGLRLLRCRSAESSGLCLRRGRWHRVAESTHLTVLRRSMGGEKEEERNSEETRSLPPSTHLQ